jgi:hypothetical protein
MYVAGKFRLAKPIDSPAVKLCELTAEADRGRRSGFPSFNVFPGGPGGLAERSPAEAVIASFSDLLAEIGGIVVGSIFPTTRFLRWLGCAVLLS